jgi:hypothetical protein
LIRIGVTLIARVCHEFVTVGGELRVIGAPDKRRRKSGFQALQYD